MTELMTILVQDLRLVTVQHNKWRH